LTCDDLASALSCYTEELGFRIDVIFPADAPRVAELSGYGISVRLEGDQESPHESDGEWGTGRAGMQYRDLIPGRLGGHLIASHIRIPKGGPVADYVHHHDVSFQMIYCYRGWVKVVYEDQGPPFVMEAGDCVLQPPHIRHRVLESSDHMEVIEVSSPAEHETHVDHDLDLPTANVDVHRVFNGQRFVFHQANSATWLPGPYDGFESRDTGITDATNTLASVQVIRPVGAAPFTVIACDTGIVLIVVLQGGVTVRRENESQHTLAAGDSFVTRAGTRSTLSDYAGNLKFLQVAFLKGRL
jgi:quercetin dioxygenase-like cupin family protein